MSSISDIQPVPIPSSLNECAKVWKTQKPLNWCVSRFTIGYGKHILAMPRNILNVIQCVAAILALIPCAIIAGIGALVHYNVTAPKIDWSKIGEAPPRIEMLDAETLSNLVPDFEAKDKLTEWFSTYVSQEEDEGASFRGDVNRVLIAGSDNYVLQNAQVYLKQIVHYLSEEQNESKRQMAVRGLFEAYKACQPTWLEGTKNVWNNLSGRDDFKNRLLGWVQEVKEEMIKEDIQITRNNSQWHGLNYARKHRGVKYGLDMSLDISRADSYINMSAYWSPGNVDALFYSSYTESRLINGVMTKMHIDLEGYGDYDRCGFIAVLQRAVNDEEYDIMGEFFETYAVKHPQFGEMEEYRINEKGVMVLLLAIGQLK